VNTLAPPPHITAAPQSKKWAFFEHFSAICDFFGAF
jgi:hypothetical protein